MMRFVMHMPHTCLSVRRLGACLFAHLSVSRERWIAGLFSVTHDPVPTPRACLPALLLPAAHSSTGSVEPEASAFARIFVCSARGRAVRKTSCPFTTWRVRNFQPGDTMQVLVLTVRLSCGLFSMSVFVFRPAGIFIRMYKLFVKSCCISLRSYLKLAIRLSMHVAQA